MSLLKPTPPPYDPLEWVKKPLGERGRMVCEAWALQGYGTPLGAYGLHVVKVAFYIGMWLVFCSLTTGLGGPATIAVWWLSPVAFQKAILWSMLFEGLGLGCGSGPLTGRYFPPVGGFLYFLRPGTTKLPAFVGLPVLGGTRRTWLDVALYAALVVALAVALVSPAIDPRLFVAIIALTVALALADRTIVLALRAEHYATTIVCFAFAGNWIAGAKAVQLALWFWAGFSKLNHHFPTVVCVMTSNSPFTRFAWLRRLMYVCYPDDLRPSRLATIMGHAGTALELGVPIILLLLTGGWTLVAGMVLMLLLHGFITSNVPMGVPIEWNVMVVYGAFALFWAHPDVSIVDVGSLPVAVFLVVMLVGVPLFGNLFPGRLSFLLAMRYYAGNSAYGVWLFRGDSYRKLDKLVKTSPWVYDQLDRFYDRSTGVGLVGKVMAFRLMHLHGRALPTLIPKAVDWLEDYEYVDGEIVAGLVLGWNFGDGHLHRESLLRAVQEQCGFDEGELRCIFVEAQPFGRSTLAYRIHDARTGLLEAGELDVAELRRRQPWAQGVSDPDVVVVGSGPNGLAAAVRLAQGGANVLVLEAAADIGGGTRSAELTLPGFVHDVCSGVHPMGGLSPWLRSLPLADHGLRWLRSGTSVAHPLDDGTAVILCRSVNATSAGLDGDAPAYRRLVAPFLADPHGLLADVLAPLGIPRHPWLLMRFGLRGIRSAVGLARRFRGGRARALLAGCAAHSILSLDRAFTGAVGLLFLILAHVEDWPVAEGGSAAIPRALAGLLAAHGGRVETGVRVRSLADLPAARLYLFDTSPAQLVDIAGPVLPARYLRRLGRYRYGPGVFKLDWALDGSIPWTDARCREASTVHLGGTIEEIAAGEAAVWRGEHPDRPYVLLCQQSELDPSRAPAGKHTGYAYCHVPAGSTVNVTDAMERQVERFAPGFRDRILARHKTAPADLERDNPNYVGGAITGGVADACQLFTRPVARLDPYTTPNPRVLLCSASTPPGGGVHGMCGYHAAGTALRRLERFARAPLR